MRCVPEKGAAVSVQAQKEKRGHERAIYRSIQPSLEPGDGHQRIWTCRQAVSGLPSAEREASGLKSFGMIDAVADEIERGKIQLFCCDSIDEETWSIWAEIPEGASSVRKQYFHYICDELVPLIRDIHAEDCGCAETS